MCSRSETKLPDQSNLIQASSWTFADMSESLCKLSATEIVHLLREQKVTPVEVVEAAIQQIEATDPAINAIPIRCFDDARQKAAAWTAGAGTHQPGYLHGLPVLIKDLTAVKGLPFTQGSLIYKDQIAQANDPLVDVLLQSGAIILGKTNTPEFGAGANTFNEVYGKTRNPWNTQLTAGGSSGGTAAALAAGQIWLGTGTDLGGSLRIPGSFCGVVGLRPSVGRVPQHFSGDPLAMGQLHLHAVSGPMARNVPDLALFLDAMAKKHSSDPLSQAPPDVPYVEAIKPGVLPPPKRVAWTPNLGISPMQPEIASICEKAARWFAEVGSEVADDCPDVHDAQHIFQTLRAASFAKYPLAAQHMMEPHRSLMKPELVWQYEKGLQLKSAEVEAAERAHQQYVGRVLKFMEQYDVLCCPCVMAGPFHIDIRWLEEVEGTKFDNYVDWLMMTYALSLVDLPVLSLPCGMTSDGRPVGLQIVGKHHGEAALLAAAAAYERQHTFSKLVPLQTLSQTGL